MEYDYVAERYKKQVEYYSKKSAECQKKYHVWSVTSIICSALVPVVTLVADLNLGFKILVAALGSMSTICGSILLHFRYQELWLRYRDTRNELESEYEQYSAKVGSYHLLDDEAAIVLFVESCEKIMTQEHASWRTVYSESKSSV